MATDLYREAEQVAEAQQRWDLDAPFALSATDGDWFLFELGRFDGKEHLSFKSLRGKLWAMDRSRDGSLLVRSGWYRGSQSAASQTVVMDAEGRVATSSYFMEFYSGGANSLRHFVGIETEDWEAVESRIREIAHSAEQSALLTYVPDSDGGHATIEIVRSKEDPRPLMPLAPSLREIWDGVLYHLYGYPY